MTEFNKVVLAKVQADTSEAPFEGFGVMYDAYRRKDYLLLAAFVIQYRGDLASPAVDASRFLVDARRYLREYRSVLAGLEKRLERQRNDPTMGSLENRQALLAQMRRQSLEIRKAATEEAERVLLLRSCLEDLARKTPVRMEVN